MQIYVKKIMGFPYFLFLVFNYDFVIFFNFTRIAASNTATDDVTH